MKSSHRIAALCACLPLAACVSERDHFYTLQTLPEGERTAAAPTVHALLSVSVPSLVDRSEMVVNTSDTGIVVLDHERWVLPLSDQVSQTLARDIENRRSDVLIGDRGFDQAALPPVIIKVDIVRMLAQPHSRVRIEAHWRVVDESVGLDRIGSNSFEAPLAGEDYAAVAKAYSLTLSELADTLAALIRR